MTQFTTIKEYDNAVRASQRKLKALNEAYWETKGEFATQELELAKAAHKFLLACRAKFKETGVSSPQLRDVQALALEEGTKLAHGVDLASGPDRTVLAYVDKSPEQLQPDLIIIDDPISPAREPTLRERMTTWAQDVLAGRKPTAAEPQAPTPIDRAREFVPSARVIRERAHAGAMRAHKFAPDDSRAQGLGYKSRQRRAEQKRRVLSLAIKPVFPAMRDSTCFLMRNSDRRILVNGQPWGLTG